MRETVINFLKVHPNILNVAWKIAKIVLTILAVFIPTKKKTMIFSSFGGRKFDDSPKAIYKEVCRRKEFDEWN